MWERWKRNRARKRVIRGDGRELQRYRWWHFLTRVLFHLSLDEPDGARRLWSVDVRLFGDSDGEVRAQLYRDGRQHAVSRLPAAFPVPGGAVEVATSTYGLRRCHYVTDDGREHQLVPDPASAEGWRSRLQHERPHLGRAIGIASVVVLVVALVLGLPQLADQVTSIPFVAAHVGTFTSPIALPRWLNLMLVVAAALASSERALRLR